MITLGGNRTSKGLRVKNLKLINQTDKAAKKKKKTTLARKLSLTKETNMNGLHAQCIDIEKKQHKH